MRYNILATAFSLFVIGFALLISPDVSFANHEGGLIPCHGIDCNICFLKQLAENIIGFLVRITFVVSALLFAVAGFMFLTGGADPGKITNAKKIFTNTFVGIVIVLTAWLVVNVLLSVLTKEGGLDPFTKVLCEDFTGFDGPSPEDFNSGGGVSENFTASGVDDNTETQTDSDSTPDISEDTSDTTTPVAETFNFGVGDGDIEVNTNNAEQFPGEDTIIEEQRQEESQQISDETNLD